jgi:hypothetical protein
VTRAPAGGRATRGADRPADLDARSVVSVSIDLPDGWRRATSDGVWPMLVQPPDWAGSFRPTLTVITTCTPGVSALGDYVEAELAGAHATLGGHLVHLDAGHRPRPHLDLVLAVEQSGVDLTVVQRHLVDVKPVDADDPGSAASGRGDTALGDGAEPATRAPDAGGGVAVGAGTAGAAAAGGLAVGVRVAGTARGLAEGGRTAGVRAVVATALAADVDWPPLAGPLLTSLRSVRAMWT